MRVRINKCNDSLLWYNNRIGEIFNVLYITKEPKDFSLWVRTGGMYNTKNFIYNSDCSEVNDNK